jgi:hypothetical protein
MFGFSVGLYNKLQNRIGHVVVEDAFVTVVVVVVVFVMVFVQADSEAVQCNLQRKQGDPPKKRKIYIHHFLRPEKKCPIRYNSILFLVSIWPHCPNILKAESYKNCFC